MDELDRAIVNRLQGGFPLCERPYAKVAADFGVEEDFLVSKIRDLLEKGILTRFGPMFDAERLGGAFTLCAMSVPHADFERVAALVNAHPEVAHNYEREHRLNMWFVLAASSTSQISRTILEIEKKTGYPVMNLPREEEFFVELRLTA
jgi:DNA-binding Lrp family transcriptional regulator